jgi:ABC-type uncharacterized transport system permease subunit
MLFILASLFAFVLFIYMLVKTWKSSVLLAILSFFFWPVIIVALIKNWNDEESDIKVPFFMWIATMILMLWFGSRVARQMEQQQETLLGVVRFLA